jgi:hypothetical protein
VRTLTGPSVYLGYKTRYKLPLKKQWIRAGVHEHFEALLLRRDPSPVDGPSGVRRFAVHQHDLRPFVGALYLA